MEQKSITGIKLAFILAMFFSSVTITACSESQAEHVEVSIESLPERRDVNNNEEQKVKPEFEYLKRLRQKTKELKSLKCTIEYLFSQPLLESRTLRKGLMYYQRYGKKSRLRINFNTLQQDDYKEQKFREEYIFDGVWLTQLDYEIKAAKLIQQAEPNEPVDAFDLAKRNFPLIGFSEAEDLTKEFEIGPAEELDIEGEKYIKFNFQVKPGSVYEQEYKTVDFWIDKKLDLPAKIIAVTTEDDIYTIQFKKAQLNKTIDAKVFEVKIPKSFGQPEVLPLEKSKSS
ncbi:MAG: LolA family protein [Planctomycetota bacterium]